MLDEEERRAAIMLHHADPHADQSHRAVGVAEVMLAIQSLLSAFHIGGELETDPIDGCASLDEGKSFTVVFAQGVKNQFVRELRANRMEAIEVRIGEDDYTTYHWRDLEEASRVRLGPESDVQRSGGPRKIWGRSERICSEPRG